MGTEVNYITFLKDLDARLESYFKDQAEYICCKKGCSACCEKGDYPISELELRYLMQGYAGVDAETKREIQKNISVIEKGGMCPFLINSECSVYEFRPIICRVHGLAYFYKDKIAKLPYCVNSGLNYAKVHENGELLAEPISENLDSQELLSGFEYGETRNLFDWLK